MNTLCLLALFAIICREIYSLKIMELDLGRVDLIREATLTDLLNPSFVEDLVLRCGVNDEYSHELPTEVIQNTGGLYTHQYPNQFSRYITFLAPYKVSSYLEVGCRWGGTFVFTTEYFSRFSTMSNAVAIDVIPSNVHRYAQYNPIAQFKQISSASDAFKNYVASTHFDVVFIDGDHEYQPVSDDFDAVKDCAQVVVFHDIDNVACPGVARKWTEVRRDYQQTYEFFEFTDQYEEVLRRTPQRSHYLGMGVAMRKAFHQSHGAVRDFSATRADNQNEVVV